MEVGHDGHGCRSLRPSKIVEENYRGKPRKSISTS